MLVLIYKILTAIVSLTQIAGPRAKEPIFKRALVEVVVYPIVLIAIIVWIVYLVRLKSESLLDLPAVLAIVVAQETVIDAIVLRVSKKVEAVDEDSSDRGE